ncbi:hypothetical protein AAU07_03090 [Listeria monocytogenes]|nr:hypothetical protein [Listeria monocytogenes]EAF2116402.1 hypothetical protein [Listeria monocytogenes]EKF1560120.1 hypothetical protein [Listeria monocytogenes]
MAKIEYGEFEDLKKQLLYKRIVKWSEEQLVLNDGTIITIECSEQDCCASAGGKFKNVELDATITNIAESDRGTYIVYDETTNSVVISIYHNQNVIAQANCYADNGNGGYYYSSCSLVVKDIHYPVIGA